MSASSATSLAGEHRYREIADLVVETDERPPRMVVIDILERLQQLPPR